MADVSAAVSGLGNALTQRSNATLKRGANASLDY